MKIIILKGDSLWEISNRIEELIENEDVPYQDISLYGEDTGKDRVESDLRIPSLFAKRKIVVWHACDAKDLKEIDGCDGAILICPNPKGAIPDDATVETYQLPRPWQSREIQKKIKKVAAQMGLPLGNGAAAALERHYGIDIETIARELDKLSCYSAIDATLVEQSATGSTATTFDLLEALLSGEPLEAFRVCTKLNQPPLQTIGFLLAEFDRFLKVKMHLPLESMSAARYKFLRKRLSLVEADYLEFALRECIAAHNQISEGGDEDFVLKTLVLLLSLLGE